MSLPPTFQNAEQYMQETMQFFDEYEYLFRRRNTEILVKDILDNIEVSNLEFVNVFDKNFSLNDLVDKDEFLTEFLKKAAKLHVTIPKIKSPDLDVAFKAPMSPKKRYEILNVLNELGNVCATNECKLIVDFGSGLGYLDQVVYDITKFNVLGIECKQGHIEGAQRRQRKYHRDSTSEVKYVKHTVTEDSHSKILEYVEEFFPQHQRFCLVGLHACADLTVESMLMFLKMDRAKCMVLMPCCYHKMSRYDIKFKYFPLSKCLKKALRKTDAGVFLGPEFLRLGAHGHAQQKEMFEMVFDLLIRAMLELYAHKYNYTIQRNKRKAVRRKDRGNFEAYILEAATKGYTLKPKGDSLPDFPRRDEIVNSFNLDVLRAMWWELSESHAFRKAAIFLLMQKQLQPIVENFVLLDRLLFFKENGVEDCCYKRLFSSKESPKCLALIASKGSK